MISEENYDIVGAVSRFQMFMDRAPIWEPSVSLSQHLVGAACGPLSYPRGGGGSSLWLQKG